MVKTFEKYNRHQIFIREVYKPVWLEFIKLIKVDNDFQQKTTDIEARGRPSFISKAILTLIYQYVLEKNTDFKLKESVVEDETSN